MHPADIQAQLIKSGVRPIEIARSLGVSHMAVAHVIYGRSKSVRIARRICEITHLDPEEVWPGRYPEFRLTPVEYDKTIEEEAA